MRARASSQGCGMSAFDNSVLGQINVLLQELGGTKQAADLAAGSPAREHLGKSEFAEPGHHPKGSSQHAAGKGAYPIPDQQHARSALGFAAMHHGKGSAIYHEIARKVHEKFGAAFLKEAEETALEHSGQGGKDPGGYEGPSSHPSAKVDA